MTAGVNANRPQKINFTQYMFPQYFANLGRSKSQRNMEEGMAQKMGPFLHVSKKVVKDQYISLLRDLTKSETDCEHLIDLFGFSNDELNYIGV